MKKFAVVRVKMGEEEETMILHAEDFNSQEEATIHVRHEMTQRQHPGCRWFVLPMEEVEV